MLTGQYDKLAKANMKKGKFKIKSIGEEEPFTNIEYEIMLIKRHNKKPDDVKALNQSAYLKSRTDKNVAK